MSGTATLSPFAKSLQTQMQEKRANITGMSNEWKDETGNGHSSSPPTSTSPTSPPSRRRDDIKQLIAAEEKAAGMLRYLGPPEGTPAAGADRSARPARRADQVRR